MVLVNEPFLIVVRILRAMLALRIQYQAYSYYSSHLVVVSYDAPIHITYNTLRMVDGMIDGYVNDAYFINVINPCGNFLGVLISMFNTTHSHGS